MYPQLFQNVGVLECCLEYCLFSISVVNLGSSVKVSKSDSALTTIIPDHLTIDSELSAPK